MRKDFEKLLKLALQMIYGDDPEVDEVVEIAKRNGFRIDSDGFVENLEDK